MNEMLEQVLQRPDVWRGGGPPGGGRPGLSTGFAAMDAAMGGWPRGALTEILTDSFGIGELRLLMPTLAALSREARWLAWVAPPFIPYPAALAVHGVDVSHVLLVRPRQGMDNAWAIEQALKSGTCGAVLAWPGRLDGVGLRRLQLAAEAGSSWGVLFREAAAAREPSPAALRIRLEPAEDGARIQVLKRRGGGVGSLQLELGLS